MQRTWVQAMVLEDPTYYGAIKPTYRNYWSPATLEPVSHHDWSPATLEPRLHNKRGHRSWEAHN